MIQISRWSVIFSENRLSTFRLMLRRRALTLPPVAAEARGCEVRFVAARAGALAPLPKST
jgi:hypothetical protein